MSRITTTLLSRNPCRTYT